MNTKNKRKKMKINKLNEESLCDLILKGKAEPIVKNSKIYVVYNTEPTIFEYNKKTKLYEQTSKIKQVTPFKDLYCKERKEDTLIYGKKMGENKYSILQKVKKDTKK